VGEILQVDPVLLELRLVEPELRVERVAELGRAVAAAAQARRRVARKSTKWSVSATKTVMSANTVRLTT
jgi:hypothetical protein